MTSPQELYESVADLAPSVDPARALSIAVAAWDEMKARAADPHDAETCRLLALAAIDLPEPDFALAEIWRTRALTRFALTGWHEGVGVLQMSRAFIALARANDDYARGRTLDLIEGASETLVIMEELALFVRSAPSGITVGPQSPSTSLLARMLHEKGGFFLLTLRRLTDARESYDRAIAVSVEAGSLRGETKSRMGAALVDCFQGDRDRAIQSTEDGVAVSADAGFPDLVAIGKHNLAAMRRGEMGLRPYEFL
ncbi:hypothetical protein [Microbacterium sp. P5_E9]